MSRSTVKSVQLADFSEPGSDNKKRFDWNTATHFLQSQIYEEVDSLTRASLLFSLEGFDYLNPDGLIWLLLMGDYLHRKENSLLLQLPRDGKQLSYIKSWDFHNVALEKFSIINSFYLDPATTIKIPFGMKFVKVNLTSLPELMRDLNNYFGRTDILKLLDITPTGQTGMEYLPPFLRTIQETTKNIVQHSGDQIDTGQGYFVINSIGKGRIRICVADAGCGFSQSLKSKKIFVQNDYDAIRNALLFRYLTPGGEGLFRVVQFVSRLGGAIRIRSSRGEASILLPQQVDLNEEDIKNLIETRLKPIRSDFYFPGVQIRIDL